MATHTRNLRHGSLTLKDGQTAANTLLVPIEEGNLTFDESTPGVVVKHRLALDHWSKGEEHEVPVSFTLKYNQYGNRNPAASGVAIVAAAAGGAVTGYSVRGFLQNEDALLTTTSGRSDVFSVTLQFTISNPVSSGDQAELLEFTQFKCESLKFSEGAECDTIAVSGRALLTTPTSTRS